MNLINQNQPAWTMQITPATPQAQADVVFMHPDSRKCPPALLSHTKKKLIHDISQTRINIQHLKIQLDAAMKRDEVLTNVLKGYHIEM
jgi:hypothetical protein